MDTSTTSSLHQETAILETCAISSNGNKDDDCVNLLHDRNKTRKFTSSSIPEPNHGQQRKKYYGAYVMSDWSVFFAYLVRSLRRVMSWNKDGTQRLVDLSVDDDKRENSGISIESRTMGLLGYEENKGIGIKQMKCQRHCRTVASSELDCVTLRDQSKKSGILPMRGRKAPRRRLVRRSAHHYLLAALLALYSVAIVTVNVAAQSSSAPTSSPIQSRVEVVFPTASPSRSPTKSPSKPPTGSPTKPPTDAPTRSPSKSPTRSPTKPPTDVPSKSPTSTPTKSPTRSPSKSPTNVPSKSPSKSPTDSPTAQPSKSPTLSPVESPSALPSIQPSGFPSEVPTAWHSKSPSQSPSEVPSNEPSKLPSGSPSSEPSKLPSAPPSNVPSREPSKLPSASPSDTPSNEPSELPSSIPSNSPTLLHTDEPSMVPSTLPSGSPSQVPSSVPSAVPSLSPSLSPSLQPSLRPSLQPSVQPSSVPSAVPSSIPTVLASGVPSKLPSVLPSAIPSENPSDAPSFAPSVSSIPSSEPSLEPSLSPSWSPSSYPSSEPTFSRPSITTVEVVQRFTLSGEVARKFTDEEVEIFQNLMVSYTINFGSRKGRDDGRVIATCEITTQLPLKGRRLLWNSWSDNILTVSQDERKLSVWEYPSLIRRRLSTSFNQVTYLMKYVSAHSETLSYSQGFRDYINGNRTKLVQDMNDAGLDIVVEAETAFARSETPRPTPTPSATPSFSPSFTPSSSPSLLPSSTPSYSPSLIPSSQPSFVPSIMPSASPSSAPSALPSLLPSSAPSSIPSGMPSMLPSVFPSQAPSGSPSMVPSDNPSVIPSNAPSVEVTAKKMANGANISPNSDSGSNIPAIAGSAAGGALIAIVLGFFVFRKRKRNNNARPEKPVPGGTGAGHDGSHTRAVSVANDFSQDLKESALHIPPPNSMIAPNDPNTVQREHVGMLSVDTSEDHHEALARRISSPDEDDDDSIEYAHGFVSHVDQDGPVDMMFTNDTLASNPSLVSPGYSMSSDSGQENDSTHHLADEFDEYKDKNLEEMRTQVENNVTNFDGMMSQALTKALMDDDDTFRDPNELTWGGSGDSTEIEASVLCEMNDWLKKREGASLDERREFMQETLNRMVASVRYGIIQPEDASRTIHGCAAMLGLQLAEDIPETALIVTGMRKMVQREDVINSFKEFGEIQDAAVSPNARGFGLVRFTSSKSVQRAMARFRTGEIVVQDVAVMIKVLRSDSPVERDFPSVVDLNRHQPGEPRRDRGGPPQPPPAPQRLAMEDSHSVVNLSTIGYSGDSGGRGSESGRTSERSSDRGGRRRYPDPPRPPASDAGSTTSARSRTSNRSHHTRNRSGETGSSGSQRRSSRRT